MWVRFPQLLPDTATPFSGDGKKKCCSWVCKGRREETQNLQAVQEPKHTTHGPQVCSCVWCGALHCSFSLSTEGDSCFLCFLRFSGADTPEDKLPLGTPQSEPTISACRSELNQVSFMGFETLGHSCYVAPQSFVSLLTEVRFPTICTG